jgi:hypothetical protein
MDSNDPHTVECAFKKRLFRQLPKASRGKLVHFRKFVRKFVQTYIPKVVPLTFEEWLDSTTYPQNRKDELTVAYDSLKGGKPSRKQCEHVDTFVKAEFYMMWKHARMINSRCDAFKAWSGPRFKAIEQVTYMLHNFIKHTPVAERPEKIANLKQAGRNYYVTDFTAFESHFTPEVLEICECELYNWCLSELVDGSFITKVLTGTNSMRTRTGVRAKIKGRRMSGDMCTSLGNGFTNLMLAKYIAHVKGGSIDGYVEGDDGIFSTDVELTEKDYAKLGFTIKIEKIPDPCTASFCGMIFGESGEIIRDPRKALMGFGWTHSCISGRSELMDQLLRAKALSSIYETPQCPIIGVMARKALELTRHVTARWEYDWYKIPRDETKIIPFSPSPDTRDLVEQVYGITIAAQLKAEQLINDLDYDGLANVIPPTFDVLEYTSKFLEIT